MHYAQTRMLPSGVAVPSSVSWASVHTSTMGASPENTLHVPAIRAYSFMLKCLATCAQMTSGSPAGSQQISIFGCER